MKEPSRQQQQQQHRRQHRRPLCCSLPYRDELEIGVQFWERLDNAVRISMACAFTGTIIFFTDQNVFANGFLAVVVILALEPAEQTVGGCLQTIPMIYRGCALGILLGVVSVVAIFQPLSAVDSDGGRLAIRIMYPIVVTVMGFIIVIWQWIPSPCKGVAGVVAILTLPSAVDDLPFSWKFLLSFCFGISTSVVFKLLPLPTTSAVPKLSTSPLSSTSTKSSSCYTVASEERRIDQRKKRHCRSKFTIRSVFALPKIRASIEEGRKLSAAIIAMLTDVLIVEARQTGFDDTDPRDDDGVVARRHVLASIRVAIQKLENEIIPQIEGGIQQAKVEILLLLIAPRSEVQALDNSLKLFHTILPTLKFLEDIVLVNHYEDEMRDDIIHELKDDPDPNLQESFTRYIDTPLRVLTKALYVDVVEGNTSKDSKIDEINHVRMAHRQLLNSVRNHRFDIFYRPSKVVDNDPAFSPKANAARWGFFARGLSFVQGMGRLACAVENTQIQESKLLSVKKTDGLPNSSASHSFSSWLRDFSSVLFAGVRWSRPFSIDRGNVRYALNFAVQVGLSSLWFAIPVLNDRLGNEGIFVAVTTCFISTGKFGLSFQKSVQRILATAIASIYVLFVIVTLDLSANQALNVTYLYILLCLLLIDRKNPYTMDCAAFTAVILLSQLDPSDTENEPQELYVLVVYRIASVGIGVIQFIIIEVLLFYDSARTRIEEQSRMHVRYIADAVDGIAAFVTRLDVDRKDEGDGEDDDRNNEDEVISAQSEPLELIKTAIGLCEDSTASAKADLLAAKQEPEPKIDIKSPFEFDGYSKLLSVQSNINTILSQILGCCEAVTESPEKDVTKPVYKYQVKMLVEMCDSVRGPFERLRSDYENRASDEVWLRDLRRFKKSKIKSIGFRSFDLIRNHSIALKAKDSTEMVDQSFILQWIAISRCLLQLCHEVSKASLCFEDIMSSHPTFCAIERLPVPSSTTEDLPKTKQDSSQNQGPRGKVDDGVGDDVDIEQQQQQQTVGTTA